MASDVAGKSGARSPRYPGLSLQDALGLVEKIYHGVHRSPTDSQTAFKLMGFAGKTGPSTKALGAVRQYGLVQGVGEKTKVSDLALRILEPASADEKADALRLAASSPPVYGQIFARFDGRAPKADEPIRAFLIREANFSSSGAEDFLASFRATMNYIDSLGLAPQPSVERPISDKRDAPETGNSDLEPPAASPRPISTTSVTPQSTAEESYRFRLTRDCAAEIRIEGEPSEKAFDVLVRHIELIKEAWAAE